MESGGAPWGASPHMEPSTTAESTTSPPTTRSVETSMFGPRVSSDPWLVNTKSAVVQPNQDVNKVGLLIIHKCQYNFDTVLKDFIIIRVPNEVSEQIAIIIQHTCNLLRI